jgi:hypothetical protein
MKRSSSLALICIALLVAVVGAQDKPNFAGTWKLPADVAPEMFQPPQMTVTQDDKVLTVTASSQMGEFKTTYNLDGTPARSPIEFNGQNIDRQTKAAWDGAKLVLTVAAEVQGQSFETKAVWSLGADGALLIESTRPDFQGGGAPVTTKSTYKKG